jgi:hypothetical protein
MKGPVRRLLFWSPRVLCVAFAIFLSLFALDVFSEGLGVWIRHSPASVNPVRRAAISQSQFPLVRESLRLAPASRRN